MLRYILKLLLYNFCLDTQSPESDIPESQPLDYGDSSFFTDDYVQGKKDY